MQKYICTLSEDTQVQRQASLLLQNCFPCSPVTFCGKDTAAVSLRQTDVDSNLSLWSQLWTHSCHPHDQPLFPACYRATCSQSNLNSSTNEAFLENKSHINAILHDANVALSCSIRIQNNVFVHIKMVAPKYSSQQQSIAVVSMLA